MDSPNLEVAIIGGGLAGMTLAIVLKKRNISCKIYELRSPTYLTGGAVMLSPNALRILDDLGIYSRISTWGFNFEVLEFANEHLERTGAYYFGQKELYGYKALRIYRNILIETTRKAVEEYGIPIEYGKKYSRIVTESANGVSFEFSDGTTSNAQLLVGADGIHSKVREYIHGSVEPKFIGYMGVSTAVKTNRLRIPQNVTVSNPLSISTPINGSFVMAPQTYHGDELFIGIQYKADDRSREEWDNLRNSKDELSQMFRNNLEAWPDMIQSAIEGAESDKLSVWPFYQMPKLDSWVSPIGNVILIGDAAHAIAPTAGQGVNQAFEDSYSLAILISRIKSLGIQHSAHALEHWQSTRMQKIDKILVLNKQLGNSRLPESQQVVIPPEERLWEDEDKANTHGEQMHWLYGTTLEEDMNDFLPER